MRLLLCLILCALPMTASAGRLWASLASAGMEITELYYDAPGRDTGHEWVEILNTGSSSLTIVAGPKGGSWRFFDGTSNRILTLVQGSGDIAPQQFVIIAQDPVQFQSDWPSWNGTLFKAALSLKNTAGTLSLKDGEGSEVDVLTYNSANGGTEDGTSLHRVGGALRSALPTPGEVFRDVQPYTPPPVVASVSTPVPAPAQDMSPTLTSAERTEDVEPMVLAATEGTLEPTVTILSSDEAREGRSGWWFVVGGMFFLLLTAGALVVGGRSPRDIADEITIIE